MRQKRWILTLDGDGAERMAVYVPPEGEINAYAVTVVDGGGNAFTLRDERLAGAMTSVRSDLEYHVRNALQRAGLFRSTGIEPDDQMGGDANG